MASIVSEGITDSPAVASAVAYFIMALAGALTLYATSHWSPERREKRRRIRHRQSHQDVNRQHDEYRDGDGEFHDRRIRQEPFDGPDRRARHDEE